VRDLFEAASMQTAQGTALLNDLSTFAASASGLAHQMRWRTDAVTVNHGKAANDEVINAWRAA
jgi:hypothetical protein